MANEAVTTAIAVRDETSAVMLTNAQLTMIANTSFVPAAFRGKVPEVLACVATGRALGLPDMTSLRGINVIEGKATLSAELMVAIVRGHGHSITGTVGETEATVKGRRGDNGDEMEATFTLDMAAKAGLTGKNNWKKHADDMLWARAVSRLCRRLFADCFAGATYVPEELEPTADEVMDEPQEPWDSGELPAAPEDVVEPATAPTDESASVPGSATAARRDLKKWLEVNNVPGEQARSVSAELFPGVAAGELDAVQVARVRERLAELLVGAEA